MARDAGGSKLYYGFFIVVRQSGLWFNSVHKKDKNKKLNVSFFKWVYTVAKDLKYIFHLIMLS